MDPIQEGDDENPAPPGGDENPAPQEENVMHLPPHLAAIGFQIIQQDPVPQEEIWLPQEENPLPQEENLALQEENAMALPPHLAAIGFQIIQQDPVPQEENAMALPPDIAALGFQIVQHDEQIQLPVLAPIQFRDLDIEEEDVVDVGTINLVSSTNHVLRAPRLIPEVREIVKLRGSVIQPNRYLCLASDGITEYNLIIPEGFMLNNLLRDGVFVIINIREDANGDKTYVVHRVIENNFVVRHYMRRGEWPHNAAFHVPF